MRGRATSAHEHTAGIASQLTNVPAAAARYLVAPGCGPQKAPHLDGMRTSPVLALLLVSGCSFTFMNPLVRRDPSFTDSSVSHPCAGADMLTIVDSVAASAWTLSALVGVPFIVGLSALGDEPFDTEAFWQAELVMGSLLLASGSSAAWGTYVSSDCHSKLRAHRAQHPAPAVPAAVPAPTKPTLPGPTYL